MQNRINKNQITFNLLLKNLLFAGQLKLIHRQSFEFMFVYYIIIYYHCV